MRSTESEASGCTRNDCVSSFGCATPRRHLSSSSVQCNGHRLISTRVCDHFLLLSFRRKGEEEDQIRSSSKKEEKKEKEIEKEEKDAR